MNIATINSMTTTPAGNLNTSTGFIAHIENGKEYTLSLKINKENEATSRIQVRSYTEISGGTSQGAVAEFALINGGGKISKTFTPSADGYLCFNGNVGVGNQEIFTEIKLEQGSTATSYSPYGMGCITEKIVNKNLFDTTQFKSTSGITVLDNKNGTIELQGVNGYWSTVDKNFHFPAGKQLFFSCAYTVSNGGSGVVNVYDSPGNSIRENSYNASGRIAFNFVVPNDGIVKFTVRCNGSTNTGYAKYTNMMLSDKNNDDYVLHQEQIHTIPTQQPMRRVGTTRDPFFKNTTDSPYYNSSLVENKWYEKHNIIEKDKQYFLNNCSVIEVGNNYVDFQSWVYPDIKHSWNKTNVKCNVLVGTSQGTGSTADMECIYSKDNSIIGFRIKHSTINTTSSSSKAECLNNFKSLMNEKDFEFIYISTTPTYLPCTDEQVQALEAYSKARTYKNVTHLYSEDEVPGYVDMTYYKDTVGIIEDLISRVEVIESEV